MEPARDEPPPGPPRLRLAESVNGVDLFVPDYGGRPEEADADADDGDVRVHIYPPAVTDPAERRALARLARPARRLLRQLDAARAVRGGPMAPFADQLALHLAVFLTSARYVAAVGLPARRDRRGRFARPHPAYRLPH